MARKLGADALLDDRELDRWLAIGERQDVVMNKLRDFFIIQGTPPTGWMYAYPIVDPTDPLMIKIAIEDKAVRGHIYFGILNFLPKFELLTERHKRLYQTAHQSIRVRNNLTTHVHPQPYDFEGESLWERNLFTPESAVARPLISCSDRWSQSDSSSENPAGISAPVSQMVLTKPLGAVPRRLADRSR